MPSSRFLKFLKGGSGDVSVCYYVYAYAGVGAAEGLGMLILKWLPLPERHQPHVYHVCCLPH